MASRVCVTPLGDDSHGCGFTGSCDVRIPNVDLSCFRQAVAGAATTFDFVLLLIIGEATQQALLGNNFSLTMAFLVITTLMSIDVGLSIAKQRFPSLERWAESVPLVLVENGRTLQKRLDKTRIDQSDIAAQAIAIRCTTCRQTSASARALCPPGTMPNTVAAFSSLCQRYPRLHSLRSPTYSA